MRNQEKQAGQPPVLKDELHRGSEDLREIGEDVARVAADLGEDLAGIGALGGEARELIGEIGRIRDKIGRDRGR